MSFGANLKRERELRGITLEEISKTTKISVRLLQAIEANRYDLLPEGIFRKSFIKGYAKYLGMNEEKVLQEYLLATESASPSSPGEEKSALGKPLVASRHPNIPLVLAILLILFIAAGVIWYFNKSGVSHPQSNPSFSNKTATPVFAQPDLPSATPLAASSPLETRSPIVTDSSPTSNKPAVGSSAAATESNLRVLGELAKKPATPPAAAESSVPVSKPEELVLKIETTGECWVSVSSGETTLYSELLQPEESKQFPLQKPLKLTLGNAGGVRLSVNGKPFTSPGKSGEVRVLVITPENYSQFVTSDR